MSESRDFSINLIKGNSHYFDNTLQFGITRSVINLVVSVTVKIWLNIRIETLSKNTLAK